MRAVIQAKGKSGQHLNLPMYGYREAPNAKGRWIIDEETAPVVKRMFDWTMAGQGTKQIADLLESEKVYNPTAANDLRHGRTPKKNPYRWNNNTVRKLLRSREYTGCTVNFKTYSKPYKLKKRLINAPENMLLIPDTQEAIVSAAHWERVQELLDQRRRPTKEPSRQGLFSGLVYCADCGSRLYYRANAPGKTGKESYICGKYSLGRGECTAHYIRESVLRAIVLDQIKYMTSYVGVGAVDFADEWLNVKRSQQEKELRSAQKRLAQARKRTDEIDELLVRVYEDYVHGVLTRERYHTILKFKA